MLFQKKNTERLDDAIEQAKRPYWREVWKYYRQNKMALWSIRLLSVLLFIAFFADFISNERPFYCKIANETYWPIFHEYGEDLGLAKLTEFYRQDWRDRDYQTVYWAPIPYSASTQDLRNAGFKSPFGDQEVKSTRFWHWLGTDMLGRDVAAGMIRGTRIALLVGLIAMSLATLIGIFFGGLAGYFGDDRLQTTWLRLILNSVGVVLAFFYAFQVRSYLLEEEASGLAFINSFLWMIGVLVLINLLARLLEKLFGIGQKLLLPVDLLVMRLIEIINSIPGLLLLLAILAIIEQPSIFNVMAIIGLLSWTGIARFVRAELLRVRNLSYVEAAQAMGFPEHRILLRHAIPNVLTPVLISIAFGIAGAILLESFLSFLGIGLPVDEISWGKMLSFVRTKVSAWWVALFPGIAIFITVTLFNLIGEGLTDAIDPKLRGRN